MSPDDPYWEKYARHQNRSTSRFVAHLFLCQNCANRLRHECLNDRAPLFVGLPVDGYCGLCNVAQRVLLYQWFICQICLNVILSYTKSFAASKTLREFWQQSILPLHPKLRLEETEVVALEPFVPGKRNKDKAVKTLDFSVYDDSLNTHGPIFFIEMKAGPGSIDEMEVFQLDINDSNDIATVCNREGIPAYVFHVQVGEEYYPPTRRAVGKTIWWTDAFTLEQNLLYVKRRRGEDKDAGYYSPRWVYA